VSIRLISHVWETSPYKGERLLLHLALADFASDEGICWPSHSTLARKARCSVGWVRLSISQMVADGLVEIIVKPGSGRGQVGRYRVIGHTDDDLKMEGHTVATVRSHSDTSDTYLLNRQEPSNLSADFDRLWAAYPKKVSKGSALKSYRQVMSKPGAPSLDVLMSAVERYALTVTDMKYCAHLATWLNTQRWEDDLPVAHGATPERREARIDDAMSMGASMARIGRSESELLESIEHRPPDEQAVALDLYRQIVSARYPSR